MFDNTLSVIFSMIMRHIQIYMLYSLLLFSKATIAKVIFTIDESGQDVIVKYRGTGVTGGQRIGWLSGDMVHNESIEPGDQGVVKMTRIVCNPRFDSSSVWLEDKDGREWVNLTKRYVPQGTVYGCSMESGQVTIKTDSFSPHCYYGGTMRFGDKMEDIIVEDERIRAKVDLCNESPEIWSRFNDTLGSCSFDTSNCKGKD